jgi:hypothetical protein
MTPTYPDLVQDYLKSEKTAQAFYDRLREIRKKRDAFEAEVKRCRTAHPGRSDSEIAAYMGVQL